MDNNSNILSIFGGASSVAGSMAGMITAGMAAKAGKPGDKEAAERASKDFESVFLKQMLENMFAESEIDNVFGDPQSEEVYRSWMIEQYSKKITEAGGIGLADHVQREMLKLQEM